MVAEGATNFELQLDTKTYKPLVTPSGFPAISVLQLDTKTYKPLVLRPH